jgi:hypothetical protein
MLTSLDLIQQGDQVHVCCFCCYLLGDTCNYMPVKRKKLIVNFTLKFFDLTLFGRVLEGFFSMIVGIEDLLNLFCMLLRIFF